MKRQAIQYLALEVHPATTVGRCGRWIRMRATEASAIHGLMRGLGPGVRVVFEDGAQAHLHDLQLPHAPRNCLVQYPRSERDEQQERSD